MTAPPDPYGREYFHGKLLDRATIQALKVAEEILGYELTILQGIGGAKASAGTHLEGRAVDLAPYDGARKVRVLEDVGFAPWERPYVAGLWGAHVHAVLIFENRANSRGLADSGWRQIGSFDRRRNGLADDGPDRNTYRPSPPAVFTLDDYRETFVPDRPKPFRNNVTRARNRLAEAQAKLSQAAALLEDTADDREVAHNVAERLKAQADAIGADLTILPKR